MGYEWKLKIEGNRTWREADHPRDELGRFVDKDDVKLPDTPLVIRFHGKEVWREDGKYSPDQPRVPAGSSEGGRWTSGSITPEIPKNLRGLKVSTYIDHGPPGYTPGRGTITRVDTNALVSVTEMRDPERVDITRGYRFGQSMPVTQMGPLIASMMARGFDPNQPITVAIEQDGRITILDGTHRLMAAEEAGLEVVPAEVRYFGLSDKDYLLRYYNE